MGKHFLWDPVEDNIVKEIDDTGTTIVDYTTEPHLYGDLISQHRDGQSSFYHYDGQGSTTALTDSAVSVTDTYAYSAFGEVTSRTGTTMNPYQYVGQKGYYQAVETGEYVARRRFLSSHIGRWGSLDSLSIPDDTNAYRYCYNTVALYTDPSGYMAHLTYTTSRRPGETLRCGAFRWDIEWKLTDITEQGFIVQEMTADITQYGCKDRKCDVSAPVKKQVKYTELWYVSFRGKRPTIYADWCSEKATPDNKDYWCNAGLNSAANNRETCGEIRYSSRAFFSGLGADNLGPFEAGRVPMAGCLVSSLGHGHFVSEGIGSNVVVRDLSTKWDCCYKPNARLKEPEKDCCSTEFRAENDEATFDEKPIVFESKKCFSESKEYSCPKMQLQCKCKGVPSVYLE